MATVYTIGHSTRTLDELIALLQVHGIEVLVDIRSFPASRRMPYFNREALEQSVPAAGIEYRWMKDLGGRRGKQKGESPNKGIRNDSFRNYADYMLTDTFEHAAEELVALAGEKRTAIMCAEAVYFRCHRMLVSDWLTAHGHTVLHIQDKNKPRPHKNTAEGRMVDGKWMYPGLF